MGTIKQWDMSSQVVFCNKKIKNLRDGNGAKLNLQSSYPGSKVMPSQPIVAQKQHTVCKSIPYKIYVH